MSKSTSQNGSASRGRFVTENPNELTVHNSVLMLIDHQPWVGFAVHSIDPGLMINNVAALA
jgi:hypothetical protein